MEDDPAEQRDRLAGARDADATRAFSRLGEALHEAVAEMPVPERDTAPVDPALAERLRDLGYVEE
jgi:hypothetical protein